MSKTNEEIKKETTLDEELEKLDKELNPENALAEKKDDEGEKDERLFARVKRDAKEAVDDQKKHPIMTAILIGTGTALGVGGTLAVGHFINKRNGESYDEPAQIPAPNPTIDAADYGMETNNLVDTDE